MSTQKEIEKVKTALENVMEDFKKSLNERQLEYLNDQIKALEDHFTARKEHFTNLFQSNMKALGERRKNASRHRLYMLNQTEESYKKQYIEEINFLETSLRKSIENMKETMCR